MVPLSNRLATLWDPIRPAQRQLLVLGAGLAILAWAYWPNLQDLFTTWRTQPNYSHGILVVPFALVIFWQRLADAKVPWTGSKAPWWSWALLVAVLAARASSYERNSQWSETATLVPAVACLLFTLGGWPLLERAWPAVAFLVFMLPLPPAVDAMVSQRLQRIATLGSVFMMQLTGLRAMANGNVIYLPDAPTNAKTLEVAQACNGLSMLMTLAAVVTAVIILFPLPTWKRIVVLASAIPIALLSNIIRILATGHCYHLMEGEAAKKFAHDWSGYLMMPLAILLVFLELQILSWLAGDGESAPEADRRPVLAMYTKPGSVTKPKAANDEI